MTKTTTLHDTPSGDTDIVSFTLWGQPFMAISAGPLFSFNPSVSFVVRSNSRQEVDTLWSKLSDGGTPLMPLDSYPFSERYGWTEDRYGLSWQIMLAGEDDASQHIVPTLMFASDVCGKAEEAVTSYTSVFPDSKVGAILRYGPDEQPDEAGTIKHVGFSLEGQEFAAMDSAASMTSRSTRRSRSSSAATRRRRSITIGRASPPFPRPSSADGSRTGTASRGRSSPPPWTK